MAANLTPIHPPSLTVRSTTVNSTDSVRKNNNWWTPLFSWSSEPDYIDSTNTSPAKSDTTLIRSSRASFTDEKAKKLRMLTLESATFHDAMYHSAIASRLASDFSDRNTL